ncbi:uncharacterized protein LOC122870237 [Siniperca chuatsi]|uniref:uncharacterized protein LOC122870237 n=1 Tax=Siniperca chuatsi TaxID=119488 RepID=UPI001CE04358|nr:uncharacterized protein LOC122870237 [Siniperca chuatsi]
MQATIQADMSVNSSNSSLYLLFYHCFDSRTAVFIYTTYLNIKILLGLPLSILIFYLGHRQWRRQSSTTRTSHSDVFTYHLAAIELTTVVAFIFFFCGSYTDLPVMKKVGFYVGNMGFPGEMFFHLLTCVERYLAVVHPVTYLGLRQSGGVRIRNISVVCVWLLCFGWTGVLALYDPHFPSIPFSCILVFTLFVVSPCSLSVLCVLIRPGPGKVGGGEERVDQSKQRAFHTVVAITGVLWLWFVGLLVCVALEASLLLSYSDGCVVAVSAIWLNLPSSLVLPLLFLHRAGKRLCCRYSSD